MKMKSITLPDVRAAALAGFLLVLPFMTMEWLTRSDRPRTDFPVPLFGIMWIFAGLFVVLVVSVVRTLRAGYSASAGIPARVSAGAVSLLLKLVCAGLIAWAWVVLVIDQMPCFLGASGC
jgi:hypothetical protein